MGKFRVILPDGRTIDGEITTEHKAFREQPVLILDGEKPARGATAADLRTAIEKALFSDMLETQYLLRQQLPIRYCYINNTL